MIIAGIIWALGGIVVILAVEAPASGRVGINSLMGIRFGPLLMSDRAWTVGHRAARVSTWAAGLSMLAGGLLVVFGSLTDEQGALVFGAGIAVLAVFVAIAARQAFVAASAELVIEQDEQDEWDAEPS
jgi:hypothetical protein